MLADIAFIYNQPHFCVDSSSSSSSFIFYNIRLRIGSSHDAVKITSYKAQRILYAKTPFYFKQQVAIYCCDQNFWLYEYKKPNFRKYI